MIRQLSPDKQSHDSVSIVCTGDIVPDVPGTDYRLDGSVPALAGLAKLHLRNCEDMVRLA